MFKIWLKKRSRIIIPIIVIFAIVILSFEILYSSIEVNGDFSNRIYSDLKNKDSVSTVCIFVPHPDDEIWLSGTIIKNFLEAEIDVHVIFYTDGRSSMRGERNIEAIKSCKNLGLQEANIHFLGFENFAQFDKNFPHGTRTSQMRDSIKNSICNTIIKLSPQLIISSDFDFNRDHRLYSILFDESIGEMRYKHLLSPKTLIWKGFCYNTSYYSKNDYYNSINLLSTIKPFEVQNKNYETDVPQYLWKDRLRLPIYKGALTRSSERNYIMDAIKNHVTQHVRLKFLSCLNSDAIFWERNVDNRLAYASLNATSGNAKYLTDFKFYDCKDVRYNKRYNVNFTDCVWTPSKLDTNKTVDFHFFRPESISNIVLYDNPSLKDNVISIKISVNDSESFFFSSIDKKGAPSCFHLNKSNVKHLSIKIEKSEGLNAGFVEIEALRPICRQIVVNKICDRDGNFIYKAFVPESQKSYKLSYYSSVHSNCSLILCKGNGVKLEDNELYFNKFFDKCVISLKDEKTGVIYDTIEIKRLSRFQEQFWNLFKRLDLLKLEFGDKIERNIFVQKFIRIMHFPQGIYGNNK